MAPAAIHRLRSARTLTALAVILALTLVAAVSAALRADAVTPMSLAGWPRADYGAPSATFQPLSFELVRDVYGTDEVPDALLAADPGPAPPASTEPATSRAPGPSPSPSPSPAPSPPPSSPKRPDTSTRLSGDMEADRATAEQGDDITYTVTIANVGPVAANAVTIEADVPHGTTLVSGTRCDGHLVRFDPNEEPMVCVDQDVPGKRGAQRLTRYVASIDAGKTHVWTFVVRVDMETPDGVKIRNRASAKANNAATTTTPQVVVIVT